MPKPKTPRAIKNWKQRCRAATFKAISDGVLVPVENCQVCGGPNAEIHHLDYDKPLEVLWLCHHHHRLTHDQSAGRGVEPRRIYKAGGVHNRKNKPKKPYADFPLYPHASGMWAKRILGRLRYFGAWHDPFAALDRYIEDRDHLHAGQEPPGSGDNLDLDELANRYLEAKLLAVDAGEVGRRQYLECRRDAKRMLDCLGRRRASASLSAMDFARLRSHLAKGRNATTLGNIIGRVRSIFSWGVRTGLLEREPRYGGEFSRPSATALRRARADSGNRCFAPGEILAALNAAKRHRKLHAMILLGINCGLGQTDCAMLCRRHLDLKAGFLDFPRPKTGQARRAALWPETIKRLQAVLREPRDDSGVPADLAGRVFLTRNRRPYVQLLEATGTVIDSIGMQFNRLLKEACVKRPGLGFYALRHTFQTVADETRDFPAVDLVMGHVPAASDMAARYRERIGDDRLQAVAEHVRAWLLG